jgi:hypothetical protein
LSLWLPRGAPQAKFHGQFKKGIQNEKRRHGNKGKSAIEEEEPRQDELNDQIVEHVRMTTSLIEDRRVSLMEIRKMLTRALRQRSLGYRKRIDYIVGYLNRAFP